MNKIHTIFPIILGSKSPRRREILLNGGFDFTVASFDADEQYPSDLKPEDVPLYLSAYKLTSFKTETDTNIVLCADTVVIYNDRVFNKPADKTEGKEMLKTLSGVTHEVITAVSIGTPVETHHIVDKSQVTFKKLSEWEIEFYIKNWQPFDKAGSYGIQDFIGMIGIERIEGSFYTIMGLPIHKVYDVLKQYIITE